MQFLQNLSAVSAVIVDKEKRNKTNSSLHNQLHIQLNMEFKKNILICTLGIEDKGLKNEKLYDNVVVLESIHFIILFMFLSLFLI